MKVITKVGLAVVEDGRLLIVKEYGKDIFLIPGGRPKDAESDLETLRREIAEELSCGIDPDSLSFIGEFSDAAANEPDTTVTVRMYRGELIGSISPASEIETIKWFDPQTDDTSILAPSIRNKILPALIDGKYL